LELPSLHICDTVRK